MIRKLRNLTLVFSITIIVSCSDKNEDQLVLNEEFISVEIPDGYKSSDNAGESSEMEEAILNIKVIDENGNEVIGQAEFVLPDNNESLISLEMTANIFEELI